MKVQASSTPNVSRAVLFRLSIGVGLSSVVASVVLASVAFNFVMMGGTGTLGHNDSRYYLLASIFTLLSLYAFLIGVATIAVAFRVRRDALWTDVRGIAAANVVIFPLGTCLFFVLRREISGVAVKSPDAPHEGR